MRTSMKNQKAASCLRHLATFSLAALFILGGYQLNAQEPLGNREKEQRQELRTAKTGPRETKGAPYAAAKPSKRIPNEDKKPQPVPTGPKAGDMKPANPAFQVREIKDRESTKPEEARQFQHRPSLFSKFSLDPSSTMPPPAPLFFKDYHELTNSISSTSDCCPEISAGENGQTIMMTGNDWMALSKNGGGTFSNLNPTTIFPQVDGGFCCDQVVVYVPRIDMFVWLLQYWSGGNGKNRIRVAAQTTPEVRASDGTGEPRVVAIATVVLGE